MDCTSSQGAGNLLLSVFLDHYLKDKYGVRYYYRYCDDGLVLGKTKAELWKIRDVIHRQMGKIDLEIKPNERVFPVEEGIDFLGYVIRPDYVAIAETYQAEVCPEDARGKIEKKTARTDCQFLRHDEARRL